MSGFTIPDSRFTSHGPCARRLAALILAGGLAVAAPGAVAQEGERVAAIEVSGARTVAEETILAKVRTRPEGLYQNAVVSEDIRRIYGLGYFTDVRADVERVPGVEGLTLIFVVQEKPSVGTIELEGHRFLRTERLRSLLPLKEGQLYDSRKLKDGVDQIKDEYRRKGFSEVEVVADAEEDPATNTAAVSLLIDEGPRMRIADILVEGNQAFPDRRIRTLMKTKRKRWFSAGVYQEQVVEEDLERIRAFYRKHGYPDIQVTREVRRGPEGRGIYVHLTLIEGLQHRVGEVAVSGVTLFPERELRRLITLTPGEVYNEEAVQEDLRLIKQYYGDRGYIHTDVAPDSQLDRATRRVTMTYRVTERDLVTINRIKVEGNLRTKDVVVRRELRVYPGERFDGGKIRTSLRRLYNLGYFEEVNVETEPTDVPNREDLVVKVKEAKTGSFSFGGGLSSVDRLVGLVEFEQRNFDWRNVPSFTGAGQDLRLRAEVGSVRRFFDLSFTEPWIFGKPVSFGVDAYNRTRLRSSEAGLGFEEEQRGGGIRLGKEFTDHVQGSLSYQLFQTVISDVKADASADLKAEQGRNKVSVVGTTLSWDSRDNRFDPTSGLFLFASGDLAGGIFAADKDFFRLQGGGSYYIPHADRFVFESRLRTGLVEAYHNSTEVPIFERFFGGGSGTIRGYRERRVGPRDPNSNDPTGGEAMLVGTLEEVMTIVEDEQGRPIIKGAAFLDVGDVWRRVAEFGESLKAGAGVGVRVNTPIGPLRLDVGFPLSDVEAEDEREPRLHFNVSRSF